MALVGVELETLKALCIIDDGALAGVELETFTSEPGSLTTRLTVYNLSETFYLWYLTKYQIKHMISILARVDKPYLP